jgi:hypothetical protein
MTRTLTAVALLLAIGACNRPQIANNSSNSSANGSAQNAAAAAAPAAPAAAGASLNNAAEVAEGGDDPAAAEREAQPGIEEEQAEGCAGEIGLPAARRLAAQCSEVSPATRPPCNTDNSCAMIREEIERGCGMLEEDAPAFCNEAR